MSNCPDCNSSETLCKDSRLSVYSGLTVKRRRRYCPSCEIRYSTYELTEENLEQLQKPTIQKAERIRALMVQIYDIVKE